MATEFINCMLAKHSRTNEVKGVLPNSIGDEGEGFTILYNTIDFPTDGDENILAKVLEKCIQYSVLPTIENPDI